MNGPFNTREEAEGFAVHAVCPDDFIFGIVEGDSQRSAQDAEAVERQRADVVAGEGRERARRVVERGVDRGVRMGGGQGQHDPLGTAFLGQVVVDQGQGDRCVVVRGHGWRG